MMFYLFIFESIGTSELLMIGLIALIIFGPRKLPQMMRTIGKTMAEFRRSTDDFKKTWEKEANFDGNEFNGSGNPDLLLGNQPTGENTVGRISVDKTNNFAAPEIREVNSDDFSVDIPVIKTAVADEVKIETAAADKRSWL